MILFLNLSINFWILKKREEERILYSKSIHSQRPMLSIDQFSSQWILSSTRSVLFIMKRKRKRRSARSLETRVTMKVQTLNFPCIVFHWSLKRDVSIRNTLHTYFPCNSAITFYFLRLSYIIVEFFQL